MCRCLVYIALNMVRAGVVRHRREWPASGYPDIQRPAERYRIIDRAALCDLLGVAEQGLAMIQNEWIESRLARGTLEREAQWSEAVAVGRRSFVERVREELGARAGYRGVEDVDGVSILRDGEEGYRRYFGVTMAALSGMPGFDSVES